MFILVQVDPVARRLLHVGCCMEDVAYRLLFRYPQEVQPSELLCKCAAKQGFPASQQPFVQLLRNNR